MLIPCNIDDRHELKKYQNEVLRKCTKVRLNDRVRIEGLHERCKIDSLEWRRCTQLLLLMYRTYSKDIAMHKVFIRNTRISRRIVFKTDSNEDTLYIYIREALILWVQDCGMTYLLILLSVLMSILLRLE